MRLRQFSRCTLCLSLSLVTHPLGMEAIPSRGKLASTGFSLLSYRLQSEPARIFGSADRMPNLSANTDAQMRPLPSVAPGFVRRLPLR
jgi:hypothetical protein